MNIIIHCRTRTIVKGTGSASIHEFHCPWTQVENCRSESSPGADLVSLLEEQKLSRKPFVASNAARSVGIECSTFNASKQSDTQSAQFIQFLEHHTPKSEQSYRFYATMERTPNTSHTLIRTQNVPSPYLLVLRATVLK